MPAWRRRPRGPAAPRAPAARDPRAQVLERVPLDAGRRIDVDTAIRVPSQLGRWALALDIVDDVDGSFAKLGTEPTDPLRGGRAAGARAGRLGVFAVRGWTTDRRPDSAASEPVTS